MVGPGLVLRLGGGRSRSSRLKVRAAGTGPGLRLRMEGLRIPRRLKSEARVGPAGPAPALLGVLTASAATPWHKAASRADCRRDRWLAKKQTQCFSTNMNTDAGNLSQ